MHRRDRRLRLVPEMRVHTGVRPFHTPPEAQGLHAQPSAQGTYDLHHTCPTLLSALGLRDPSGSLGTHHLAAAILLLVCRRAH